MKNFVYNLILIFTVFVMAFSSTGCFMFRLWADFLQDGDNDDGGSEVKLSDPVKIELIFPDGRYAKANEDIAYDCVVVVNDGALPASAYDLVWTVDGEVVDYDGAAYVFEKQAQAKTVEVSVLLTYLPQGSIVEKTLNASSTFVYFEGVPQITVEREENEFSIVTDGGHYFIEWFANGERVGEGNALSYEPSVGGRYEISAKANGYELEIEDPWVVSSKATSVSGLSVDFDTYYPSIMLEWDDVYGGEYEIKLNYNDEDKIYSTFENYYLFTQEQFPLSDYKVTSSVKCKGDEYVAESAYVSKSTDKLSYAQVQYLSRSYGIENAYISSNEDFYVQFDLMMLSREQPVNNATEMERTFYMGYSGYGNIDALTNTAFERCSYAGSYTLGSELFGNIATVALSFKTVSTPYHPNNVSAPLDYSKNIDGYKLEIGTEKESDFDFYIDGLQGVSVSTTDMLYRVAELGYKPLPVAGSRAEEFYAYAKDVLIDIVDEDMSDYEKALAIYEWVMFKNNYNNDVLSITTQQAVLSPAFYIEGVLSPSFGYGVCDGIAKTYSLLCNMIGIPCMRVTGEAGSDGDVGAHAWNKVKVDGEWYIVDATWGDQALTLEYRTSILGSSSSQNYELGLHTFFLVTDGDVAYDHFEDDNDYPKTAKIAYGYYKNKSAGTNDFYLNETGASLDVAIKNIASHIIESVKGANTFVVGDKLVNSKFYIFEISYNVGNKKEVFNRFKSTSYLASALKDKDLSYAFFETNGVIVVVVTPYYRLANNSL